MKNQKITRNIPSYFWAGMIAGLVVSGFKFEDIENYDYKDLAFGSLWRKFLEAYESGEYHEDGIKAMEDLMFRYNFQMLKESNGELKITKLP